MLIRNFTGEKKKRKRKILLVTIIIGLALIIFNRKFTNFDGNSWPQKEYKIGDKVSVEGIIKQENNFPHYTHKLNTERQTIRLKSTVINLNTYTNKNIGIAGQVNEIYKGTPVIDVSSIDDSENHLFIKNNKYIFGKELLLLDFSKQPNMSASKSGHDISITYQWNTIMNIETFGCTKVTSNNDCKKILFDYQVGEKDNFVSFLWYTFYRHEKNNRISFNNELYGYIFKPDSDDTILNISHMIYIIDKNFLLEFKKNLIDQYCIKDDEKLTNIQESTLEILDNDLVKRTVQGDISWWKKSTCKLVLNLTKDRKVEDVIQKNE